MRIGFGSRFTAAGRFDPHIASGEATFLRRPIMWAVATHAALLCLALAALRSFAAGPQGNPSDNGNVSFSAAAGNEIVSLFTRLVVPPEPEKVGTLFLWPGLQPRRGDQNYYPIDNGVLQPVLTWGQSCAPGKQPKEHSTWWISAQYVNTYGRYTGYDDCYGGPIMSVKPGDTLLIGMSLFRSMWTETVLVLNTTRYTSFHINLADQAQGIAWFSIEPKDGSPGSDVEFLETTIGFAGPDPSNCRLEAHGPDDVVTKPIAVGGGQSCTIGKIALKAPTGTQSVKSHLQHR
jgi:hypothetical protein